MIKWLCILTVLGLTACSRINYVSSYSNGPLPVALEPNGTATVSGTMVAFHGRQPLVNATVVIGSIPDSSTCRGWKGCGHPVGTLHHAVTDVQGGFTITAVQTGTWFLQVSKNGYAELHRRIVVNRSMNLGSVRLLQLTPDESQELALLNHDRRTIAFPHTPGNLVIDEYGEEQVRKEAALMAKGKIPPMTDPVYKHVSDDLGASYFFNEGAWAGYQDWSSADQIWFSEKRYCPHGNWQTCPFRTSFNKETGHYIWLSDGANIWVGIAEGPIPKAPGYYNHLVLTFLAGKGGWKGGS